MFNKQKVGVIIAAAGTSNRMGGIDKMFAPLGDKPVLARVVSVFEASPLVDRIVIVLNASNLAQGQKLDRTEDWQKVDAIIPGGLRRQDSVKEGLVRLNDCRWIIIHDGARPLVNIELIENGLMAAKGTGAAVAAVPVTDTIKLADEQNLVMETLPRQKLWAVQTPQVFKFDIINRAYQAADSEVTDDAALVEALGIKVKLYPGNYNNIKLTTPADLVGAELMWQRKGC
jgi:2-C-methyl-D-erythritol 4-phosphate cytidylyltransferase